jgi:hypothetical protein
MSKEMRDMTGEQLPPSGAMEGGGAYNNNAKPQASGGAFALPHLENAARSIALDADSQPIVIADYGSSQGRNSLLPMRVANRCQILAEFDTLGATISWPPTGIGEEPQVETTVASATCPNSSSQRRAVVRVSFGNSRFATARFIGELNLDGAVQESKADFGDALSVLQLPCAAGEKSRR